MFIPTEVLIQLMAKAYDQAENFNFDQIDVTTYRSIEISGDINENQEWSGTVTLMGDVTVPNGVTLTILPGTVIKTQPDTNYGLIIRGILNVNGTVDQKVIFGEEKSRKSPGKEYGSKAPEMR